MLIELYILKSKLSYQFQHPPAHGTFINKSSRQLTLNDFAADTIDYTPAKVQFFCGLAKEMITI